MVASRIAGSRGSTFIVAEFDHFSRIRIDVNAEKLHPRSCQANVHYASLNLVVVTQKSDAR